MPALISRIASSSALGIAGGFRLDHPLDLAVGAAHDAPVASRDRRARSSSSSRRRRRRRGPRGSRRRSSAEISGWSPERTRTVSASSISGSAARIAPAGAVGLRLHDGLDLVGQAGRDVDAGRDDRRDTAGAGLARGEDRPGDQRPPADGMEHLRRRGAHARALARRHDRAPEANSPLDRNAGGARMGHPSVCWVFATSSVPLSLTSRAKRGRRALGMPHPGASASAGTAPSDVRKLRERSLPTRATEVRVQPAKIRSMPTRRPIAQSALLGNLARTRMPIRRPAKPLRPTRPAPCWPRPAKATKIRVIPMKRK